jgi:hypothetical protein
MLLTHKDILLKLEKLERKAAQHDGDIQVIFDHLKELLDTRAYAHDRIQAHRGIEILLLNTYVEVGTG